MVSRIETKVGIRVETIIKTSETVHRVRPMSTYGDVRLTVFAWMPPVVKRDDVYALDYTRAAMLLAAESDRLLVKATYGSKGQLIDLLSPA